MVLLSSHRPSVLTAVPANEGSPVRSTGRWDSYEVKCMTGRYVPRSEKLLCQGESRINTDIVKDDSSASNIG